MEPTKTPLRSALYARRSPTVEKGGEGESYSIASQVKALRKRAADKGYAPPLEFIDDLVMGAVLDRPGLNELRKLIRAKELDVVLVYSQDRLFRELVHGLILRDEANKHGAAYDFLSGNYENTPEGKLMYNMQGIVSEFEREKIKERTLRGRKEKAEQGFVHSGGRGQALYGYRYVGLKEGSRGKLEIDSIDSNGNLTGRAAIAYQMFTMAANGQKLWAITRWLNEKGIPAPEGGKWARPVVSALMQNTTYKGWATNRHGIKIPCPAIVSEELWETVRQQQLVNIVMGRGRPSHRYLLSGMCRCGRCGHRCRGNTAGCSWQYVCNYIDIYNGNRLCDAPSINGRKLEVAVWDGVWEKITDEQFLLDSVRDYHDEMTSAKPDGAAKQLDRLRREEQRKLTVLSDPDVAYAKAKEELVAIRLQIQALVSASQHVWSLPKEHQVKAWCRKIREAMPESFQGKRAVLEQVATTVTIRDDKTVDVEGTVPFYCHDDQNEYRSEN
jgi:site-specific DNA recombinase